MASFTSTLYTIGTALSRAQDAEVAVDLLVTGQWIHGRVSALDGHGVVLHGEDDELSIIRMQSIDAVKVRQAAVFEGGPRWRRAVTRTRPSPCRAARPIRCRPRPATGRSDPPLPKVGTCMRRRRTAGPSGPNVPAMRNSTLYTIGTALSRAQGTGVSVDVLVAGQWLSGHVNALDGHGLVLHRNDGVLSVLRMESISAVQVRHAEAFEERPEVEQHQPEDGAHPMPAAPGRRLGQRQR